MNDRNLQRFELLGRFATLGVMALGLLIATKLIVTIPFGRAAWDFVFILDGAYRISIGLIPHIDFSSPIGSLPLYVVAFVQWAFPEVHPFVGMHTAIWFLMAFLIAALAPRFTNNTEFLTATALASFIALLPMTLDATHLSEISYFATYNRFASAFLFLGGLWLVLPKRSHDWLLLAYILFVLFFLKITAAIVFLLVVIAAIILGRCDWRQGILSLSALGIALLVIQTATGLTFQYLADIAMMSTVNQGTAIFKIFYTGFVNWIPLAVTGVFFLATLNALQCNQRLILKKPIHAISVLFHEEHVVIDTILLIVAAWVAESQNTGGLGLIAALAILFHRDAWQKHRLPMGILVAALLFPVADIAVKRSVIALSREKISVPEHKLDEILSGTRIPLPTYEGSRILERMSQEWLLMAREVQAARFPLTSDPTSNAVAAQLVWFHSVVEAAEAFDKNGYRTQATRFTTVAFADPFTRLLQLTPAKGTLLVMDRQRTVPDYSLDQMRTYLANADGVFLERCNMLNDKLETLFSPILQTEFEALPLTKCWDLFIRKKVN